jgi:2-polyprenyl-3-methyl-5-hydroxy-6-metoxy-1,4-benzoquinol methylase
MTVAAGPPRKGRVSRAAVESHEPRNPSGAGRPFCAVPGVPVPGSVIPMFRRFGNRSHHMDKLRYLLWALAERRRPPDPCCPACRSAMTDVIRRKYVVTSLRECRRCRLRFRTPKDHDNREFYQADTYQQGFTTDLPSDEALARLLAVGFADTEKDFGPYIRLLASQGISAGATLLDFGGSWGYGTWQMQRAGLRVWSYEVSRARSRYAAQKLRCQVLDVPEAIPVKADCLFSAHVIEHLLDPNEIFETARRVLKPGGLIVCFCPNGNPDMEQRWGIRRYDQLWGKVHPLMITPGFLQAACQRHGFAAELYTSPYTPGRRNLQGDELCLVARMQQTTVE